MDDIEVTAGTARYALNPIYLFRWEATQDAHVLLYPEGIVKLNRTAGEIIELCDGRRTASAAGHFNQQDEGTQVIGCPLKCLVGRVRSTIGVGRL